jgi:glycosyltransferase involved in cell wall biosynthesis
MENNIESSILTMQFDVNHTDTIFETSRNSRIRSRFDQFLQSFITSKVNRQFGLYSFPIIGTNISRNELIRSADVIYLHWVQGGYLNFAGYRQLAKLGKPVIIFMHDMWSITGGCHHSFTCEKYMTQCSDCPMFKKKGIIDWVNLEFRRKRKLYSGYQNLYFVSPSKWLYDCAKKSFLTKDKPVYHIPNIVDSSLFKPVGKMFARKFLNIDENETVIAFGAFEISSAYKGWLELMKAINILHTGKSVKDLTVLVFGASFNKKIADTVPFKTHFMGFLKDEYSTVLVYNAIDVFVTPSLADNFPTTVLECQSCGTPVVGFEVGGIPEIIKHKENGYLAKYKDADDLANGIRFCLENKIKGYLLPQFSMSNLIQKHIELIETVTK